MSMPGSMLTPCGCVCGIRDSCACADAMNEQRTTSIVFIESPDRTVCVDEASLASGLQHGHEPCPPMAGLAERSERTVDAGFFHRRRLPGVRTLARNWRMLP